jgi:hypothetical protein
MKRFPILLSLAVASAIAQLSHAEGLSLAPEDFVALVTPQEADAKRNYAPLRFDEDWRWLGAGAKNHDLFDPIKYIQLGSPDLTLTFGGSARYRYESKINAGFGASNPTSPKHDDYSLMRAYIHGDLRYKTYARIFIEGEFNYIDGFRRNPPPTPFPSEDADLHQAFIDLSPFNFAKDGFGATLRLGRQELLFDKQKLVGPLDWANTRRAWDGVTGIFQFEQYKAQIFWVRPVVVNSEYFDNPDEQTNFAGAYLTHPMWDKDNNYSVFAYYLNRSRDTKASFSPSATEFNPDLQAGNTDRVTVGGRVWGKFANGFDYDAEGGAQFGRLAQNDILAGYFSGEVGYTFKDVWGAPRLSFGYDYASGDNHRDGQSNTFDQLFPTGHLYMGYLDYVGRQNINAGNVTLTVTPYKDLKVWASYHYFCLADSNDALYNAGGAALRYNSAGAAGSHVGSELDITATYQLSRHVSLLLGYGIFFPGEFIENTGASDEAHMVYGSVEFKF